MIAKTDHGLRLLEGAYALDGPDGNRRYYRDMAARYDSEFAAGLGYDYPRAVAATYLAQADAGDTPIADIGCGTGLVAQALGGVGPVDGMDISPDMLALAAEKTLYRRLYEVDLTADMATIQNNYGAVLSAGTFTHGHLGPQALVDLLHIVRPGALLVIGINAGHYAAMGFALVLENLFSTEKIGPLTMVEAPIYTKLDHSHSAETALILSFRRG